MLDHGHHDHVHQEAEPSTAAAASSAAAAAAAARLAELTGVDHHDVAVVLGSGWRDAAGVLASRGTQLGEATFAELGGFPPASVPGHDPRVLSLGVGGRHLL